ncbi:MAG: hypothetical protein ACR2P4_09515 [Gammaproteobacteria bacterium]
MPFLSVVKLPVVSCRLSVVIRQFGRILLYNGGGRWFAALDRNKRRKNND